MEEDDERVGDFSGGPLLNEPATSPSNLKMPSTTTAALPSSSFPAKEETSTDSNVFLDFISLTTENITQCFDRSEPLEFHVLSGQLSFSAELSCYLRIECSVKLIAPTDLVIDMQVSFDVSTPYRVQLIVMNSESERKSLGAFRTSVENSHLQSSGNHVNLLLMCEYSPTKIYVDLYLNFTAVPQPRLDVNFTSPTTGYVQSPGWNGRRKYPSLFDGWARVDVPANHSIMISFVQLKIFGGNGYCLADKLTIQVGDPKTWIGWQQGTKLCSEVPFPKPEVFHTDVLSFHFVTDGIAESFGFKLLFSFHHESAVPVKTISGLWNCSVDYWPHFQQHVGLCNMIQNCYGGEDEANCSFLYQHCDPGSFSVGGECYTFIVQDKYITWMEAESVCLRQHAYLASLNSPDEWDDVSELLSQIIESQMADRSFTGGAVNIYVGLRIRDSSLPEVYRNSFEWSDKSSALFFKLDRLEKIGLQIGCTYLRHGMLTLEKNTLSMTSCNERIARTFLCEKKYSTKTTPHSIDESPEKILLPTVEWPETSKYVTCPTGHVVFNFLSCDLQSKCWAQNVYPSGFSCEVPVTPLPPSFECSNGVGRVPYTLVCDHRPDCSDNSDEYFCSFPECQSEAAKQFQCTNKQCLLQQQVCDLIAQCLDGSDERYCHQKVHNDECFANSALALCHLLEGMRTTPTPPAVVNFDRHGLIQVESMDASLCPDTHFLCPGQWIYCLPLFLRCNGVHDCPNREDEMRCDSYLCPGFYRCRASSICVHSSHMCDGVFQCPQRDDELLCGFVCPENCTCHGLAFFCSSPFVFKDYPELRFLDGQGSGISLENLAANIMLVFLNIAECGLTQLTHVVFPNLQRLDLSRNHLEMITDEDLISMEKLQKLSLAGNPLTSLFVTTGDPSLRFPLLQSLDLSDISIITLNVSMLSLFPSLMSLNLSGCGVERLVGGRFHSLIPLKYLNVERCPMHHFPKDIFQGLLTLTEVWADNYKICCPANLPEDFKLMNCHSPSDEISSCDALLRSGFYRVLLVLFSVLALLGNFGSFVYRVFVFGRGASNLGFDAFVTHLCVSDFLMGVYLAIIGVADRIFIGTYLWNDMTWKNSVICKMAGFLSLLSSEVSAFIVCLITVDRFLVLRFPFSSLHFRKKSAHVACGIVWLVGIILAGIPLLPMTSHWAFYSQNGICIPLPITRNTFAGHDYSFTIMIVVNFILFLLIATGQVFIFWSIRANSMKSKDSTKKSKDLTIARRLITIAMSDFLCWFPIGLLGVLASSGVPIPGEVNVAVAIIILPVNSAINPFLYTINILLEKRRKVREKRIQKTVTSLVASKFKEVSIAKLKDENLTNGEVLGLIKTWFSRGIVSSSNMEDIIKEDRANRMLTQDTNDCGAI